MIKIQLHYKENHIKDVYSHYIENILSIINMKLHVYFNKQIKDKLTDMSGSSKNLNNYFLNSKIKQISTNKSSKTTDNSPFKTDRLAKSASGTIRKDSTNSNITCSTTPKKNKLYGKRSIIS